MSPKDDPTDLVLTPSPSGRKRVNQAYILKLMMRCIIDLSETATVREYLLGELKEVVRGKL